MTSDPAAATPAAPTAPDATATDGPSRSPESSAPLRWPEWFRAFDLALVVMAVVLAFLVASFVSRNADLWRHLAAGRLLTKFNYPVGGDPFTYSAAERVWVNANWLTEVVFYGLYSLDPTGAVLLAVKAMAFAGTLAVLLLLRRPQFSLWPWVVAITLAAIGMCLQAQLRPIVFGWLLHAVFLTVLFRADWSRGGKWRIPLMLGGITALWANTDTFAFLAPLSVALLLLGEWLHQLVPKAPPPAPGTDPFPAVPPMPALGRALAVTCVALLLNPMFLAGVVRQPAEAIAQLVPFECNFLAKSTLAGDKDLVQITWSLGNREYYDSKNSIFGRNLNSAVTGLMAVAVLALTVIGYRHGRVSHLALWIGMAILPLVFHARFVGAFLIVSAILMACHLNALGLRASALRSTHQAARPFRSLAIFGRLVTLLTLAVLIIVAIPGWLQPKFGERAMDRWVAWAVEPDEGMKRAALLVQGWREDPMKSAALAGEHGMNVHPDFADYAAWYAPAEKSFVNSRYQFHRNELPDLAALRQMIVYGKKEGEPAERPLIALLEKNAATYLCVGRSLNNASVNYNVAELLAPDRKASGLSGMELFWHLDGRFIVIARADTPERVQRFAPLVWNVARDAFAPRSPDTDEGTDIPIGFRLPEGWENDFILRPAIQPVELSDSKAYSSQAQVRQYLLRQEAQARSLETNRKVLTGYLLGGGAIFFQARQTAPKPVEQGDIDFALPLLATQTARRATHRNPDDARGFNELSLAYTLDIPELEPGENRTQVLTALTRAEARQPLPVEGEHPRQLMDMLDVQVRLYKYHLQSDSLQNQNLDHARTALGNVNKLITAAPIDEINPDLMVSLWNDWYTALWVELGTFTGAQVSNRPPMEQLLEALVRQKMLEANDDIRKWGPKDRADVSFDLLVDRLRKLEISMKEAVRRRNDIAERQPAERRFQVYIQLGLPGKAIELVKDESTKAKVPDEYVLGVLYKVGQLESAYLYRKKLEEETANLSATDPRSQHYRNLLRQFERKEAMLAGQFKRAELLLEEEFKLVAPPKLSATEMAVLKAESVGFIAGVGATTGGWPFALTFNNTQVLKQRLYTESMFLYQRGVMALLNGDTRMAKTHFDNANRPQGVELQTLGIPQESIELAGYLPKYRELLEKYGKPGK